MVEEAMVDCEIAAASISTFPNMFNL